MQATSWATWRRKIESARYFAWRAADYLDKHSQHAELVGAMCKINVTEAMIDCVYKCMQVVGVNSESMMFGLFSIARAKNLTTPKIVRS